MKSSSSTTSSSTLNNEKKTPALEPNKIDTMIRARQINHQSKISTIQRKLPSSQPDSTINSSTVSCRKTLSKPRSFNNTIAPVNRRTHLKGSLSNGNQNELQVTMLKEQLAKLQSELRIVRGQVTAVDSQPASRSKTPPSKSHSPCRTPTASSSPKNRKKSISVSRTRSSRKSSSSVSSEPTDGLSIRFISGPGIPSSRSSHPSPLNMDDNNTLPITDSGYIKDSAGVWVPLNSPPAIINSPSSNPSSHRDFTRLKPQSPADPSRGLSRIPISAVALGRVLAGDPHVSDHQPHPLDILEEPEPVEEASENIPPTSVNSSSTSASSPPIDEINGTPNSEPSGSQPSAVSRQPRGNPFFSSGGGRDRGAMIHQHTTGLDRTTNGGNTGKVITTLQSDLLYARTALDQSKSQLRLSQRAVESLNRQTEDLKESMSRLRLENEGLSKMLSRKERTVSELMDRLKRSEAELSTLKQEKKELDVNFKKISKETDEIVKDSVRRRDRAETQYEAVRSGVKSLSEGWKRDVTTLKQDISRLEEKHRKEMDDSRLKYNTLAKLHASRSGALSRIETDLNNLQSSKEGFIAKYTSELSVLKAHLEEEEKKSCEGLQLAKEVSDECARFKRLLRTHSDSPSSRSPNGMPR